MRIKKISGDEVMVFLNARDLEYFNFHAENGVPEAGDINNFLFDLMELVHTETGFDPYNGGRVMIEAMHTEHGMKLSICRIGCRSEKKLTREQFKRARGVRARVPGVADKISAEEYDELVRLLHDISVLKEAITPSRETFILDSFSAMEAALCNLAEEELKNCVLYRGGSRYAIVSRCAGKGRLRNVLGEYAELYYGGELLADDISEGWTELVRGEKLLEMARALRKMQ